MRILSILLFGFVSLVSNAQQVAIGQWQSYFSYQNAVAVTKMKDNIYCGSHNLFAYSTSNKDFTVYSKINGLSDVGIKILEVNDANTLMVIVYQNGNLDLFENGVFRNIPDIKNVNIVGSKKINDVYFYNNLIYLSTDFGVVVLNPQKNEIKETYSLQVTGSNAQVKSFIVDNGLFYAVTDKGIFTIAENNPVPQNYANWSLINTEPLLYIKKYNNALFVANKTKLFLLQGNTLTNTYTSGAPIVRVRNGISSLLLVENTYSNTRITKINSAGIVTDSLFNINPYDVLEYTSNDYWAADGYRGLMHMGDNTIRDATNPNGPYASKCYNINYSNNKMFLTPGAEDGWIYTFNTDGFSILENGFWNWKCQYYGIPQLSTVTDMLNITQDKRNNNIYCASFGNGLIEIKPDNTVTKYKDNGYIISAQGDPGSNRVSDVQFDKNNNLWMTLYGSIYQLVVKKADGSWQKFGLPNSNADNPAGDLEIDDINQKWIVGPRGRGLYVYNDNNTIDNLNDDKKILLGTGKGNGNLPSGFVTCLAKDKTGKIWVGTYSGVGIFNSPEAVFTDDGKDAELKIVKYDANAGLLFSTENVRTIAVDGANNKWIGSNNGVWQITDDAEKILQHFTKDNSPLPSNEINKIEIDPVTGTVYFATNEGLVSYRNNATDGVETMDNVLVFPNPVPSNYNGYIAIKGLTENADVKITDVSGQLVYSTKAQGGTATWNGKTYSGRKPQTGVYYVFISNTDGSETKSTKFIFNE